ncbi:MULTISPECIES: cytochrome bd oxidase small subunit CydS [Sporosarcina]|uniref:Uncharacterized protein n=2 Tax=Sporosarcina newyorkensis TaxID=759851 RepID=A0A1T4YRZ9_9BACL|nr:MULTISPECIES: hypothetical protein [Sporosarcina]EGQ26013.1 hypothetical protein HMPREF9372_1962 [Sporosarcina newyorkensis 2681]SKB04617.1 hypothetical protein SAMN04244570_3476 [Sporosarcina newyorkensis]
MNEFLIFYAPFLVVIAGIVLSFFVVLKDDAVTRSEYKESEKTDV